MEGKILTAAAELLSFILMCWDDHVARHRACYYWIKHYITRLMSNYATTPRSVPARLTQLGGAAQRVVFALAAK